MVKHGIVCSKHISTSVDNEVLRHEKDRMSERMRELAQASDSAKSTVELQDMSTRHPIFCDLS